MTFPTVSLTVGMMVLDVPVEPVACSWMDWTRQVVKVMGTLVAVPTAANTGVMPGVFAVTIT